MDKIKTILHSPRLIWSSKVQQGQNEKKIDLGYQVDPAYNGYQDAMSCKSEGGQTGGDHITH